MGLFDKFTETIFLKTDSELEVKIDMLEELNNKYPNNEEINKDLMLAKLGLKGEKDIEFELRNANLGMYVLHDITLKYDDITAQIDYVIVTAGKVYLVECKNLVGNITVNEQGNFIREFNYNERKIKEGIYSPLSQAERHVGILKKIFLEEATFLDKLFTKERFDNWYVPLVVMTNSKNILNTKYAPREYKDKIIRADQLIKYISDDINSIDRNLLISKRKMENKAKWFLSLNTLIKKDYKNYYIEKFNLKNNLINNNIKDKLVEFRCNKSKEKGIPAYYIFTNEELDNILDKMPKNLEQLKDLDILSSVKLKLHGDEIIDIITNSDR